MPQIMFKLLAEYNQKMNQQCIDARQVLGNSAVNEHQNAFFGSILGTMNHLIVGDLIWLHRFSKSEPFYCLSRLDEFPVPYALNDILFSHLADYATARHQLDKLIIEFIDEVTENQMNLVISYQNTKGQSLQKELGLLLTHFFNHQTHHRGQASALLFQQGVDVGVTDFVMMIPNR